MNVRLQTVFEAETISIKRLPVPGGWLYVTRTNKAGSHSVATSFVPDADQENQA